MFSFLLKKWGRFAPVFFILEWIKKRRLKKYHVSAKTISLKNWINFSENGETKWLLKNENAKPCMFGQLAFEAIQEERIDTLGISPQYLILLRKKIKIEKMFIEVLESGDKSKELLIKKELEEVERIENSGQKQDLMRTIMELEKSRGVPIDTNISLFEFDKRLKSLA